MSEKQNNAICKTIYRNRSLCAKYIEEVQNFVLYFLNIFNT